MKLRHLLQGIKDRVAAKPEIESSSDWPDNADGGVFRNLQASKFPFGLSHTVDYNVDFTSWPPAELALKVLHDRFGSISIHQPEEEHGAGVGGFVASAGQELRFSLLPNVGPAPPSPGIDYFFGGSGYIDVPLDGNVPGFFGSPFLTRGAPFLLEFVAGAASSCGDEIPATCGATSDFGSTALIGNARIVDQNGNVVPGASFTSTSGYGYVVPPGSLISTTPVPEPETWALMLAGIGLLGFVARRRRR